MRTAVFDLDGTLADTAADLIAAANAAAAPLGWGALDPRGDRALAGRGGRALLAAARARAGREPDPEAVEAAVPAFLAVYEARIAEETRLFPNALACLDAFAADGWAVGVCTNKPERLARLLLEALGVAGRFGALVGADTLPVRKPDPAPLAETVRRLGGDPARAVMIGDTVTDRETARRAGAPCILCRFGYEAGALDALGAEALIDDLSEAPSVAAGLLGGRRPRPAGP
jgi:phosphoglycolate phosphatase